MKIKITESQLSMIKKLREEANDFESTFQTYNNFCLEKAKELDAIYRKLINESIGNVLNKEVNVKEISDMVQKIYDQLYPAYKKITNMLELRFDDEEDELELYEYDNKIFYANNYVEKKSNALNFILDHMEKLQDEDDEHNVKEPFKNIKPIDIQSFGPGDFES
jgi:DNA repair ATPase RecN